MRRLIEATFLCLVCGACSSKPNPSDCYLGDRARPAELVMVNRLPSGTFVDVVEGGTVGLEQPPQGGKTIFVGVRAKNIGCALDLTTSLVDEASGTVVGLDGRPVLLGAASSGFGEPERPAELDNYSNLPACPNGNLRIRRDLQGGTFVLEVTATDRFGKSATVRHRVVPTCSEPDRLAQCRCECGACYELGDACVDGGAVQPIDAGVCPSRDGGVGSNDAGLANDAGIDGGAH